MKEISYNFKPITNCDMCGAKLSEFKILGRRLNGSQGRNPGRKIGITTTIMKCRNCGLVFSNPMPIPLKFEDHYGVNPSEYWSDDYFTIDEPFRKSIVNQVEKFTAGKNNIKCLDIGSGIGRKMRVFLDAGYDAYGFEASSLFYNYAIEKLNVPKEKLVNCSLDDANYPANSFDYISFNAVLEHLYHPSDALSKCLIWLKPGGIMEVEVPSSDWLIGRIINFYYKLTCKDYVSNISPMHTPFHLYEFTPKCFELNGIKNGYSVKTYHYFHGIIRIPLIVKLLFNWIMNKTNTGMQLFLFIEKNK